MRDSRLLAAITLSVLLGCTESSGTLPARGPVALTSGGGMTASLATAEQRHRLAGMAEFPVSRSVAASSTEVLDGATVSLIDTARKTTVATTVTGSDGAFTLELGSFSPDPGRTYLVEAVKGLADNRPGHDSPRLRTFVKFDGTAWKYISAPRLVINALTTAVAIVSGLDPDAVSPDATMEKVNVSGPAAGLNPAPAFPGHGDDEVVSLAEDVIRFLTGDLDPVAAVDRIDPEVVETTANSGRPGDVIVLRGAGFSPLIGGNSVTFDGIEGTILAASSVRLVVRVPDGARTGTLAVRTGRGSADAGRFDVSGSSPVALTSISAYQGEPGVRLTLQGSGFSPTTDGNTIAFGGGATARPIEAHASSLIVTVPAEALSGTVTVQTPAGTSNGVYFAVPPAIGSVFPDRSVRGEEVRIEGSRFGASGSVEFAGVAAKVTSWSDRRIEAIVPAAGSGPVTVTATGARSGGPTFTVLQGDLSPPTLLPSHLQPLTQSGGSLLRLGRFLYVIEGDGRMERARLDATGEVLEAFATLPGRVLPGTHRSHPSIVRAGQFVYAAGGSPCLNAMYRATITGEDDLSTFMQVPGMTFPGGGFYGHSTQRIGSYLYTFGGECGGTSFNRVHKMVLKPDGSLDTAAGVASAGTLTQSKTGPLTVVIGPWVYSIAGFIMGTGLTTRIERASIDGNGLIGTFQTYGILAPGGVAMMGGAVLGGKLWVFGGWPGYWGFNPAPVDTSFGFGGFEPTRFSLAGPQNTNTNDHPNPSLVVGDNLYVLRRSVGASPLQVAKIR